VPADEMPMNAEPAAHQARPPLGAPGARARCLVLIEQDGAMLARLFDDRLQLVEEFDGTTEEVGVMTAGLRDQGGADAARWDRALAGHAPHERAAARVYLLDV
jgi:hypothetical protein